jgi:hypothetical protein
LKQRPKGLVQNERKAGDALADPRPEQPIKAVTRATFIGLTRRRASTSNEAGNPRDVVSSKSSSKWSTRARNQPIKAMDKGLHKPLQTGVIKLKPRTQLKKKARGGARPTSKSGDLGYNPGTNKLRQGSVVGNWEEVHTQIQRHPIKSHHPSWPRRGEHSSPHSLGKESREGANKCKVMEKHMALLAEHPNVATNAPKVAGGRCSAGDARPTTNPTMGAR